FCLTFDAVLMPLGTPLIQVGHYWLLGEAIGLAIGLIPAQLLARWTARNENLKERVLLQICAFTGLMLFVLPTVVITQSGSSWRSPVTLPIWQLSLYIQILMVPAVLGLTAVQEFAMTGHGT